MACIDCKPNILNNQQSIIASPLCNDCDELEVDCGGEYIWTDCVKSNVALSCIETAIGATQTSINQALDTKLCQVLDGTVKVSVSEPDTCPGYLEDKITAGDGITITVEENVSGCQHLVISEKCWEWTTIPSGTGVNKLINGWKSFSSSGIIGSDTFQVPQYSNEKECLIKLRGSVFIPSFTLSSVILMQLSNTPLYDRFYSVVARSSSTNIYYYGHILINTSGQVILSLNSGASSIKNLIVTLEGIQFELN